MAPEGSDLVFMIGEELLEHVPGTPSQAARDALARAAEAGVRGHWRLGAEA